MNRGKEEMDFPMWALAQCNDDHPSVITSFFKVLIENDLSELLYLPPKFAQTVLDLIDKEMPLEDETGRRWTVTISKCNGSLAFQQGWLAFSRDHCLEIGDFVVFHYIVGSHFVVRIHAKSAFEIKFSEENGRGRKRTRTGRSPISVAGPSRLVDDDSMNKWGSNTSVLSGSNVQANQSQLGRATKKDPVIRRCDQSLGLPMEGNDHVYGVVKIEPVETFEEIPLLTSAHISVVGLADDRPFLVLPICLPSLPIRGRSVTEKQVLVLLRDPLSRLWPVLYHEKLELKVLTGGWSLFKKANRIQQGDECVFTYEHESDCTYRVAILRK
ncbi:hypothetical protein NMG60_11002876 [Bertholletia excelsa]